MHRLGRKAVALGAALAALFLTAPAATAASATPIPSIGLPPASPFVGAPFSPAPILGTFTPPQNPFMAANGVSEIHDDGWQTDAYRWNGPLGRGLVTASAYLPPARDCGSVTFDSHGRVISICIGATGPELYMFDPNSLATLATFSLPPRTAEDLALNPNLFQDFSGGGYFYLDQAGDVVTGTTTRHIYVIGSAGDSFRLLHDYDLSGVLHPDEEITSQLPDSHGLLWFTARRDGVVGTLNLGTGTVRVLRLGQGSVGEITKSLAVDGVGGVYIPTNQRLYRFIAGAGGVPRISWSAPYPNTGVAKVGQLDAGTGTTPVISGPYVAINDNADPMDVVVFRTAVHPSRAVWVRRSHGKRRRRRVRVGRTVCRVPVFTRGASADENALIAAGRSFVIENNSGYSSPLSTSAGALTAPGFARIEVSPNGLSCRLVWTNTSVRAPSVVSKLSLADGLIYTYTIEPGLTDPWYWTALSFTTGHVVWKRYAGAGFLFNNNYAGISISPRGVAYLGVLGGLISLRDT